MTSYISDHWRGHHSLTRSLGLNTVVFTIAMVIALSYFTSWIEVNHLLADNTLLFFLVGFWLTIFLWQAVGAFRAATLRIANYGSVSNYYVVFAIVSACCVFALGSVATQYGEAIDYRQRAVDEYKPAEPTFTLTIDQSKHLQFNGDIGHGATAKLSAMLKQSPNSTLITLNSSGGLIAEARGLANVIKKYGLNTAASSNCFSACTIAFIAGAERSLMPGASLGFHQYYVDSKTPLPWMDPQAEQTKDLLYFQEKNVADWFMRKAYSTAHSTIWVPSFEELHSAGVITPSVN